MGSFVFMASLFLGMAHAQPAGTDMETGKTVPPVIERYYEALDTVYTSGSTRQDIDRLFTLFTDDVRYIHRNYGADFGREEWIAAFERNRRNGAYTNEPNVCMTITNVIPGNGYAAIEYAEGDAASGECVPDGPERLLAVFKVEDGKISMIEELW